MSLRKKVLITVKTYPTLSSKYDELVCTAGITEEGDWIRVYPIPYRKMEYYQKYKKYQWIELDLEKNTSDFRKESYKPINIDNMKTLNVVETDKSGVWQERRNIVIKNVYTNLTKLITDSYTQENFVSLATFKPSKINKFSYEKEKELEWDRNKLLKLKQMDLFSDTEKAFNVVNKLPYKFYYHFEDDEGKQSKMMIEDWEIGALYWSCLKNNNNNEEIAVQKVKEQYFDNFVNNKDLYLFLGTTLEFHRRKAKNPFVIIGVFYPKPIIDKKDSISQPTLFDL